jgi:hypothetical protein
VEVKKRDSLEATAALGVKNIFDRPERYRKSKLAREDRAECWNTRRPILRKDDWVELMLFRDRIGLQRRILLSKINLSVAPLHSRNPLRPSGSK